ncbi:MAG: hypothetical protein PHE54_03800 [Bacilli bacterium]|nr:hypothetical protein [Bacilli bacterium]
MAEQKGSLKNRLLTSHIIRANLKNKKQAETEMEKEKRAKELRDLQKQIYFMKPASVLVINPNQVTHINDDKDFKEGNITKALSKTLVISDNTQIIEDEKAKIKTTYVTSSELKVLKEEVTAQIEEEQKENSIIKKVNSIIKQAKKDIKAVKEELTSLNQEVEQDYEVKQVKGKEERYEKIREKIAFLYDKYQIIMENVNFSDFYRLNDEILLDEIINYKITTATNEKVETLAASCKKEIKLLEGIVSIIKEKNQVKMQIDTKKTNLKKRDEKFDEYQNQVNHQEEINSKIKALSIDYDNELVDIENKYRKLNDSKYMEINKLNFLTINILKLSVFMSGVRNKNISLVLTSILMQNLIIKTNDDRKNIFLDKMYSGYVDTGRKLDKLAYNLDDVMVLIEKSIYEVEDLATYFEKEFKEYQNVLPEYNKIKERVEVVLNILKSKEQQIKQQATNLKNLKCQNKEKIKTLESLTDV